MPEFRNLLVDLAGILTSGIASSRFQRAFASARSASKAVKAFFTELSPAAFHSVYH